MPTKPCVLYNNDNIYYIKLVSTVANEEVSSRRHAVYGLNPYT